MINYLAEINSFHDWLVSNPGLSPSARLLWFSLMHYNNRNGWKAEFNLAISALELDTGLSKQSLIRARNALQQAGLIKVLPRKGNQSTVYRIIPFAFQNGTQSDTQTGTQSDTQTDTQADTQTDTQTDTIPKHKHKLNKNKNNPLTPLQVVTTFAGENQELLSALKGWIELRTKIKKPLTARAAELGCKKLESLSNGDRALMVHIVDQTVMAGWQGFFPYKGDRQQAAAEYTPPHQKAPDPDCPKCHGQGYYLDHNQYVECDCWR